MWFLYILTRHTDDNRNGREGVDMSNRYSEMEERVLTCQIDIQRPIFVSRK